MCSAIRHLPSALIAAHSHPGMFIGHFALGYAAKRWVPQLSLAVLFGAAQLADLVWPVLVALGVEQVRIVPGITASTPLEFISYPYSHSLAALVMWGALFGWLCRSTFAPTSHIATVDEPIASASAPKDPPELRRHRPIAPILGALVVSH